MSALATAVRPAAIVALLLAAVAGTVWVSLARQEKQALLVSRERLPWQTEEARPRFLIDREGWMRTPDEHVVETTFDLSNSPSLLQIPYQLNGWTGRDAEVTNGETLPTLAADYFLFRQYWRPDGAFLWLTAIGSTRGQSFHAPTVCYVAANWTVEDRPPVYVPVGDDQIALRAITAQLDSGERFVDVHWYLWTDVRREWRLGATLMRLTVPVVTTEEQARAVAAEFAKNFFSRVLS
ncbi:MAG TPA: exosortase-associated EpsI family protein [Chloroflexota bacterium]|nr:exosortase-associated EpsI family protein [Chloroflexota bacterium]